MNEPGARLTSLDAYRGLIMLTLLCGSIFASLKGHPTLHWLYEQDEHVPWAGCVYWDLIQPSFMFMVGVAMPFAYAGRIARGDSCGKMFVHALKRALVLLLIGIVLDHFGSDKIQIGFIRVLQQIAIGYLIAFFTVGQGLRVPAISAAAILVGYQLVWMFNPWNGPGGPWAMSHENIGSAFDFWMLGRNYSGYYVGLNAIPAAATIIFGVIAGEWVRTERNPAKAMRGLWIGGLGGMAAGLAVSPWFPLIKRIWTPSFAVFAAGCTTLMLLVFYWAIEVRGWRKWSFPLVVVGMNSIAAYVLASAFGGWWRSLSNAWLGWLKAPLGDVWFPVFQRASFALAAWFVLFWLYRRRIFLKA